MEFTREQIIKRKDTIKKDISDRGLEVVKKSVKSKLSVIALNELIKDECLSNS